MQYSCYVALFNRPPFARRHYEFFFHSDKCSHQLGHRLGRLWLLVLPLQPNSPPDDYASDSIHPIFFISTRAVVSSVVIQDSGRSWYSLYYPIPHSTTLLRRPFIRYSPFRQVPSPALLSFRTPVEVGINSTAQFPTRRLRFGLHSSDILHFDKCRRKLSRHSGLL